MRLILYSTFFFILFSCSVKSPGYIQGYIYTKQKKPLENIKIEDPYNSNTYSLTDEKGYFRIDKSTQGIYLHVIKNNQIIDTIQYVRTHPERKSQHLFVEGRNDTLFVDVAR